jgi:transcriptional regulator with XRE-family HTH domain
MDVGDLLRVARAKAGWSQRVLAARAAASQAQIARYETGAVSPTVATLDRLLATCGLQARVRLEPLMADVDARVDTMLAGEPAAPGGDLPALIRVLEDRPGAVHLGIPGRKPHREGPVTWAFDGGTALLLQGLAVDEGDTGLVVVWNDAARHWLLGIGAQAITPRGDAVSWRGLDLEQARECTQGGLFTYGGFLGLRLVAELPRTTAMAVPWWDEPVPVVSVDEVEQHHPEHAEVLARLRARRAQT